MKKRILIVDDERNIRTTLKMCLSGEEYETETAADGEEGLKKAEENKYDLIFLDIKMPGMNGMEVLEELRKKGNKTSIVIMTAYGTIENAVRAMKLHAVDFIPKPFTPGEIREAAKKVFERENLEENKLRTFEDYIEFAKLSIISNNFKKAEEILKQAVGKDPSSPVTHNLLGVISEYKGDVQQAQKYYRAALALDPTYEPAESNIRRTVEFDYSTAGIKLD